MQVLHLGRNNSMHQYRLELTRWRTALLKKTFCCGQWVDHKETKWPCRNCGEHHQQFRGADPSLFRAGGTKSGVLNAVLRYQYKRDTSMLVWVLLRATERLRDCNVSRTRRNWESWDVQPREEKPQGLSMCVNTCLRGVKKIELAIGV